MENGGPQSVAFEGGSVGHHFSYSMKDGGTTKCHIRWRMGRTPRAIFDGGWGTTNCHIRWMMGEHQVSYSMEDGYATKYSIELFLSLQYNMCLIRSCYLLTDNCITSLLYHISLRL